MPAFGAIASAEAASVNAQLQIFAASRTELGPGAVVLHGFATGVADALLAAVESVAARAPFRIMTTPNGRPMSVAMTNCGTAGWISDGSGYRYSGIDPLSGESWPAMPASIAGLALSAALEGGFADFVPDACLINRYEPGARLSLHQDKDEMDFRAPIVSVSLGLPAVFLFGGARRADRPLRISLTHGDVVVWGGPARLRFHGVLPLAEGDHPLVGRRRVNLTLRKAR
jgi:alkylated DNA repair protein (DNA oxidative demethylase)